MGDSKQAETDWSKLSPLALWREGAAKSEAQWSEAMGRLLKDERAGGAINRQIDELRMMHRLYGEMAQASLAAANLPSRSDFEALDERLGRVEDGLAQVSASLVALRDALVASGAAKPTTTRPPRTRKPPAAKKAAP